ncbi:MAG: lysophospholipase [Oscillospiraceae bacterium]|nr:lysophospholipase [Oscillospiraceae bacterium]
MKNIFKRVPGLMLALVLMMTATLPAVLAAPDKSCGCDGLPLIVVQGFGATALYKDRGGEKEVIVFPPTDITHILKTVAGKAPYIIYGLARGIQKNSMDSFVRGLLPAVKPLFEPLRCGADGALLDPLVDCAVFPESMAHYGEEDRGLAMGHGIKHGETYGWDHVYVMTYDFRRGVFDLAEELGGMIQKAKAETGHAKVNIAAHSMGAAVLSAYLAEIAEPDGFGDLNNVVLTSPGWQGTSMIGDLFTGGVELNYKAFQRLFTGMLPELPGFVPEKAPAYLFNALFWGLDRVGFTAGFNRFVDSGFRLYIRDMMKYWQGMWALVPRERYQAARAFCFPDGGGPEEQALLARLDRYAEIQENSRLVLQAMQDADVGFAVVALNYGPMLPIFRSAGLVVTDRLIDLKYASGFARVADLDGAPFAAQEIDHGHGHLSPDGKIDASTAYFPEKTWFIEGLDHSNYAPGESPSEMVFWLLEGGCRGDVRSNGQYPQFTVYE